MDNEAIKKLWENAPKAVVEKLSMVEYAYLYYFQESRGNKVEAYFNTHDCQYINAKKNSAKYDRKVKLKYPEYWEQINEAVRKNDYTPKEKLYIKELKNNNMNKVKAVTKVSEAKPNNLSRAAMQIENKLTVKNPNWRNELVKDYKPSKYFKNLDVMANKEHNPESRRKANNDMLSYLGFTKIGVNDLSPERGKRSIHDKTIDRILNIQVNVSPPTDNLENTCTSTIDITPE